MRTVSTHLQWNFVLHVVICLGRILGGISQSSNGSRQMGPLLSGAQLYMAQLCQNPFAKIPLCDSHVGSIQSTIYGLSSSKCQLATRVSHRPPVLNIN